MFYSLYLLTLFFLFFFFNDTATTEIYTLSLHDALPIYLITRDHVMVIHVHLGAIDNRERITRLLPARQVRREQLRRLRRRSTRLRIDRKSTRLNSSHT